MRNIEAEKHLAVHLAFHGRVADDHYHIRSRFSTPHVNAISFTLHDFDASTDEASIIASIPNAARIFRVRSVKRPKVVRKYGLRREEGGGLSRRAGLDATPSTGEPIHHFTGVNDARSKLGLTGKGVTVAIIDTGVYYLHPALGGGFGPGHTVKGGYDLVGDNYGLNATSVAVAVPDPDPIDNCSPESHGTHVTGIVVGDSTLAFTSTAANASDFHTKGVNFTGVAPGASILAYKVFGCEGETGNDILAQAIYRAEQDGADLINMSVGGGPDYADEVDVFAATAVGNRGHYVFGSIGNDGQAGAMVGGGEGIGRDAFAIASFDNTDVDFLSLTVDNKPYPYLVGENANFTLGKAYPVIANDLDADVNDSMNDGLTNDTTVDATGKALLIRWGTGKSKTRCDHAYALGAVACILYSNVDGQLLAIKGSAYIPSLFTSRAAGLQLLADLKLTGSAYITVTDDYGVFPLLSAPRVSNFSSAGLAQDLALKPDFGGIGGNVFSTISPHSQKSQGLTTPYAVMSGTSMSSPYSVGIAALVLEAKGKNISYNELRMLLQMIGAAYQFSQNNAVYQMYVSDQIDSVARQGAGLLNAYNAVTATTQISPPALALNDTDNLLPTHPLTITNMAAYAQTYTLTSVSAAQLNWHAPGDDAAEIYPNQTLTRSEAAVTFNNAPQSLTITVPAGSSSVVNVSINPPGFADPTLYPFYSGYIVITAPNATQQQVPYAGMSGSWNAAPVWSRSSKSFDALLHLPGQVAAFRALLGPEAVAPDATASTGIYDGSGTFSPLAEGARLNLTTGALVLVAAATSSHYASVTAVYAGAAPESVANVTKGSPVILACPLSFPISFDPSTNTTQVVGAISQGLTFSPLQRSESDPAGPSQSLLPPLVFVWGGGVMARGSNDTMVLPEGRWRLEFKALRHFAMWGREKGMEAEVG
ncbi:hypothetical protein HK101_009216 [Irineochytrium annulatum]|nr:hypothetical protein HK101_009216 [Irineochytrium annulatum]